MAITKGIDALTKLLDAYGVGVRAGVITPCLEDEEEFRAAMGLGPCSADVVADWKKGKGVRRPITLGGSVLPSEKDDPAGGVL